MDLQIFITFSTFIITFLFILGMILKQSRKSKVNSLLSPPGPSKLPVIGNLHQLLGLPHHSLRDLANIHGPLMSLKLGQLPLVIVSSPIVASQMMKTHDLAFVDRPFNLSSKIMSYEGRGIVMAPYGEYWRQMRKICILELLSVRRVQSFWSIRQDKVSNLVQRISLMAAGSPINLSEKLCTLINDITARAAFGKTCKDKQAFISGMKNLTRLASGFAISDLFPPLKFLEIISGTKATLERAHQKIDKILDDIVKDHKENRMPIKDEEDLVDVLLRVQNDSVLEFPITPEHLKAVIFDVFSAGTETSSTALEWTFSELLRNRRVLEKVQGEVRRVLNGRINEISEEDLKKLNYLRLVVKETLRLHPPAPLLLPRECRETCKMEGCEIPRGTKVMVNAWAIGRDPKHWKDPESYEPERFQDKDIDYRGNNFEYIPFGAGRRICPGISFGVANIEHPLALLLYHFDWKLAYQVKPEELNMTEAFGVIVGRKTHLFVIATPYDPQGTICISN